MQSLLWLLLRAARIASADPNPVEWRARPARLDPHRVGLGALIEVKMLRGRAKAKAKAKAKDKTKTKKQKKRKREAKRRASELFARNWPLASAH